MSDENYRELLDKAIALLPPESSKKEKFEKPKPVSSISGNRTILYNLKDICDRFKRERHHLLRYLAGELATSGTIDGSRAIFQGKFNNRALEQLIDRYISDYVLCPVCHHPDTRIIRKDRVSFLVCEACGASSSIRAT